MTTTSLTAGKIPTESEKICYKEAFLLMDENRCGTITPDDVRLLIRALGFTPTEADLKRIDTELIHGENVDYLWFVDMMSKIVCSQYTFEQVQNAFLAFDINHYGLINVDTFKTAMMTMGEPLSDFEMKEMLKDLPIDEDGFIEYENVWLQFKSKNETVVSSIQIDQPT